MKYVGKVWFEKPLQMKKIAERLDLEDISIHKTEDITGTMKWRGGDILVLLHLSWGDMSNTEKIRIFVHHIEDTDVDEFFKLIIERLKDIAVEILMSPQEIGNITKKEIDKIDITDNKR